jgi:NTE family protein
MKRALILSGGGARGAFQIGVWRYLQDKGWDPDMICGTSVGAINAVAIGSGMPLTNLLDIWKTQHRTKMYRLRILQFVWSIITGRPPSPLMDTGPLRSMITRFLDIEELRRSPRKIIITAVNLLTSKLTLFNNSVIDIDHVMASSAMPILFPWQYIDGEPYWDGGVMANTPLFPALENGSEEIIIVLLSPVGHQLRKEPKNLMTAGEMVFEHFLIGSCQSTLMNQTGRYKNGRLPGSTSLEKTDSDSGNNRPRIAMVSPSRMLGFRSLLNFSTKQAHRLIDEGYRNAENQLRDLL